MESTGCGTVCALVKRATPAVATAMGNIQYFLIFFSFGLLFFNSAFDALPCSLNSSGSLSPFVQTTRHISCHFLVTNYLPFVLENRNLRFSNGVKTPLLISAVGVPRRGGFRENE
jgi:hypothetical protein